MKIIPPETLLEAYARGVFPMAEDGEILWFSPERRGLIPLDERFHIPHGLAKSLKRKPFEIRWDTAFREVMLGCADREETWIDEVILDSFCALHQLGRAHSVECWDAEGLQGGLYGVALPGAFSARACFPARPTRRKLHSSPWSGACASKASPC
jgi:leucyl/phenylalanyl-tRNA--protein transferase